MSFSVELGVCDSPHNKVGKTVRYFDSLVGTLRHGSSIINPEIMIDKSADTLYACNYLHIPEFGRYYFVTDITAETYNMSVISCHVDVLDTYASQIRSNNALLYRSADKWNMYIDDGILSTYAPRYVQTFTFPSGFTGNSFVMAVAGAGGGSV